MAFFDFEDHIVVTPEGFIIPGAIVLVFNPADVARATPLQVYDQNGTPKANLIANNVGRTPPFRIETLMEVTLVSGEFVKTVGSYAGLKAIALAAQTSAASAVTAAQSAATAAAASAALAGVPTQDAINAALAAAARPSSLALDTDTVPYYLEGSTSVSLYLDTDGVPYTS